MSSPIFVDANIPIYAAARRHTLKEPRGQVLCFIAEQPQLFVTDAEVLQELSHRYPALQLWPQGSKAVRGFARLMHGRVESVHSSDIEQAVSAVEQRPGFSARDLLHLAVIERIGATRIVSADRDFDRAPRIERLDPADIASWSSALA